MDTPSGNKQSVDSFLVLAFYAERIANIAQNYDEASRWSDLADACAANAGLPPLSMVMGHGDPGVVVATSTPPVCP